jgi:hypothetical protein
MKFLNGIVGYEICISQITTANGSLTQGLNVNTLCTEKKSKHLNVMYTYDININST